MQPSHNSAKEAAHIGPFVGETGVAWAAGILEGEAWICAPKYGRSAAFALSMTDRDVVTTFASVFGLPAPTPKPPPKMRPGRQMQWEVRAYGASALEVMLKCRPYMHGRRGARIDEVAASWRDRYERECGICGDVFTLVPKASARQRYCGASCADAAHLAHKQRRRAAAKVVAL